MDFAPEPREEERVHALRRCAYNACGNYVIQNLDFDGDETVEAQPQVNSVRIRVSGPSGGKREKKRL